MGILTIRPKEELDKWFEENGWERSKTAFGMGWKKKDHMPFIDNMMVHRGVLMNEEEFIVKEDNSGNEVLFFEGTNKHYYREWLCDANETKFDMLVNKKVTEENFWD